MVDEDLIKKLLKDKENSTLDLKLKISSKPKIAKTISAFANTEGGKLLIGVSDDRRLVGIDLEEEKYMIQSANAEFCTPQASITFEEISVWPDPNNKTDSNEINLLLVLIEKSKSGKVFVNELGAQKAYVRHADQTLVELNSQSEE